MKTKKRCTITAVFCVTWLYVPTIPASEIRIQAGPTPFCALEVGAVQLATSNSPDAVYATHLSPTISGGSFTVHRPTNGYSGISWPVGCRKVDRNQDGYGEAFPGQAGTLTFSAWDIIDSDETWLRVWYSSSNRLISPASNVVDVYVDGVKARSFRPTDTGAGLPSPADGWGVYTSVWLNISHVVARNSTFSISTPGQQWGDVQLASIDLATSPSDEAVVLDINAASIPQQLYQTSNGVHHSYLLNSETAPGVGLIALGATEQWPFSAASAVLDLSVIADPSSLGDACWVGLTYSKHSPSTSDVVVRLNDDVKSFKPRRTGSWSTNFRQDWLSFCD